jgi:prophage regulatory protein
MNTLMTLPEVAMKTRLSRSTIYRLLEQNLFPKPRKFSARKTMWLQADIEEWLMTGGRSNA